MVPKGSAPTFESKVTCPITGKAMVRNLLNGRFQPETPYRADENPEGLNARIEAAGYDPNAYMEFERAVPRLAYIVSAGERVAEITPARDRGKFGGWQIVPLSGTTPTFGGIGERWEMPAEYSIEWCI